MAYIELLSVFSIAFLGALGHCVGMCGGLVLAYTSMKLSPTNHTATTTSTTNFSDTNASTELHAPSSTKILTQPTKPIQPTLFCQLRAHCLYIFGRICSYMILGALAGALGMGFGAILQYKSVLLFALNSLLVIFGLCFIFSPRILRFFEPQIHAFPRFSALFSRLLRAHCAFSFFTLGMLNGILPCGIVYYFLLTALSTQSALGGIAVMGIFGLATMCVMLPFSLFASSLIGFLSQKKRIFHILCGVSMSAFGIYNLSKLL
ncbi:sulfite exporter TauE/SafE family protein [Helicobacter himalayensis]|uniref:sulfite exporter TauE/SafE family protein n=1 Tax=Helicobacter himalayensis TaxID=1591088 RepID=UPI003D6ED1F9